MGCIDSCVIGPHSKHFCFCFILLLQASSNCLAEMISHADKLFTVRNLGFQLWNVISLSKHDKVSWPIAAIVLLRWMPEYEIRCTWLFSHWIPFVWWRTHLWASKFYEKFFSLLGCVWMPCINGMPCLLLMGNIKQSFKCVINLSHLATNDITWVAFRGQNTPPC